MRSLQWYKRGAAYNSSVINYDQLYAQMMHKLRDKQTPYWFTIDEVARIQEFNQPSSR